jgi:hypothetical protein
METIKQFSIFLISSRNIFIYRGLERLVSLQEYLLITWSDINKDGKNDHYVAWNNVIIRLLVKEKRTFVKEEPISPSSFLPVTPSFFMVPG